MTRLGLTALIAVLVGIAVGFWIERQGVKSDAARSGSGAEQARAEQLARSVCATCHLFPEPSLLTKTEWAHQILPEMAQWLGLEPVDFEGMRDGKILRQAKLYPEAPTISTEDWFAIWDYYVSAAPQRRSPSPARSSMGDPAALFRARKLNFHAGLPAISLIKIDPPGQRFYVGDAFAHLLAAVDASGQVQSRTRVPSAPVALVENDQGRYLTLIGQFYPSDLTEGAVVFLEKNQNLAEAMPEILLDQLRRPVEAKVGDLNGDGRLDLVVCSYGNRLGRFSWFETKEDMRLEEHVLLDRPGALRCELRDLDRDGRLDIIVMTAQAREGIYLLFNQGQGRFRTQTVTEQHPLFGYASLEVVDFNGDGHLDFLTANGDNGDHAAPHKPYHGFRLLLNDGQNQFHEAWFYPMEGAYKALAADFDQDGDLDVAGIAYYPDFASTPVETAVYLENQGGLKFKARALPASQAGRWMVMDAGDVDGDGDVDLALGSFLAGPTTIPVPVRVQEQWRNEGAAVLLLENGRR